MHELIELLDHSLQESPMADQEVGELTHNIHDISSDLCLGVLSVSVFTKVQ